MAASDGASPTRALPLARPELPQAGPYTLHTLLGSGGFGAVYVGSVAGGPRVAVKVLTFEGHGARERFSAEARLLHQLDGRGFPSYITGDLTAARPWFAMELLEGITVDEAVRHAGPMSAQTVAAVALDLARSLHRLHGLGFVHRDVKPANAVLAGRHATLIDVGIAKGERGLDLTSTGEMIGSAAWAAPERLLGDRATAASDVYGLGLLVAYASAGQRPFPSGDDARTVAAVVDGRLDLTGVPDALRDVVVAMTALDPDERADMAQAAAALADLARGEASTDQAPRSRVQPRPVPRPEPEPAPAPAPAPTSVPVPPSPTRAVTAPTVHAPAPKQPAPVGAEEAVQRLAGNPRLAASLRAAHERGYDRAAVAIVARAQRRSHRRAVKALDPARVKATVWRGHGWYDDQHAARRRFADTDEGWSKERALVRRGWWLDKAAGFTAMLGILLVVVAGAGERGTAARAPFGWLDSFLPFVAVRDGRGLAWDLLALLVAVGALLVLGVRWSREGRVARGVGAPQSIRIGPGLLVAAYAVVGVATVLTVLGILA